MKHLPYWLGAIALIILLGALGEDDYQHAVANTAYVEHVMEMARQEELNRRHDAWFNLYEDPATFSPTVALK